MTRALGRGAPRRSRAALAAVEVPTWSPRVLAAAPAALRFILAPARLPHGRRVYAIGDVHGDRRALDAMHAAIRVDLAARPVASALVVHLGDLTGPGPDSAGVVSLLASGPALEAAASLAIRGDREQALLDAVGGDAAAATDVIHAGGQAILASWGIGSGTPREAWGHLLPTSHVAFLRTLPNAYHEGGYLFVHAGVRPGVPLARQTGADMRGIRQPFLSSDAAFGAVVVHGHSVAPEPVLRPNRIGLDTGAGIGGRLTCAVLEEDRVAFLSPEASTEGTTS